ncbi:MAG: hypothetical protein DRP45_12055 [Candidatus Zixiibacteriota bacterium]|nr:MAG: hypothetical protein DRP45_12055 [candidate division Zixibacteria bacterium]
MKAIEAERRQLKDFPRAEDVDNADGWQLNFSALLSVQVRVDNIGLEEIESVILALANMGYVGLESE